MIGMFKKFLELGVPRKLARVWMIAFHDLRLDHFDREGGEPDFVKIPANVLRTKNIEAIEIVKGDWIPLDYSCQDFILINFRSILFQIDTYVK